jgi:hypothetical protein
MVNRSGLVRLTQYVDRLGLAEFRRCLAMRAEGNSLGALGNQSALVRSAATVNGQLGRETQTRGPGKSETGAGVLPKAIGMAEIGVQAIGTAEAGTVVDRVGDGMMTDGPIGRTTGEIRKTITGGTR